jgi:FlaG/FlaF family flagellin (archaellin)
MRKTRKITTHENAVSPVVGVMLMLVVTIIIAAVVSAFAGGMTTAKKAPSIDATCTIVNNGYWGGSWFNFKVNSVSEPIPTSDLKLMTTWTAKDGTHNSTSISAPGNVPYTSLNTHYYNPTVYYQTPIAFGPGVAKYTEYSSKGDIQPDGLSTHTYFYAQQWGNYTLVAGTFLKETPINYDNFAYINTTSGSYVYNYGTDIDAMQATLGMDWWHLQPGDTVNVKLYHIPSAQVIYNKNVLVQGG